MRADPTNAIRACGGWSNARISRRSLLATSMLVAFSHRLSAQTLPKTSVKDYGAKGDGVTNDTDALTRALSQFKGDLWFPKGIYRFNHVLTVASTARKIVFEAGAILRGDNPLEGGLLLVNGAATEIDGATISWARAPTTRTSVGAGIQVKNCTDVVLKNVTIDSASGAGLLFYDCTRPVVDGAKVSATLADGVHFANCDSPKATHIETSNTGDDGLAFVNYAKSVNASGGYASDIMIADSHARGIAVVGQSDVTVENFAVWRTRVSALYVAQEPSYNTRFPQNVKFKSGQVESAGILQGSGGNRFGIEVVRGRDVHFEQIIFSSCAARMASITQSSGLVEFTDIHFDNNKSGEGVYLDTNENIRLIRVWVDDASNTGLYAHNNKSLEWQNLVIEDAGSRGTSKTALIVDDVDHVAGDAVGIVRSDPTKHASRYVLRGILAGKISNPYLAESKNKAPAASPRSPQLFISGATATTVPFTKPQKLEAISPEVSDSPGLALTP